MKFQLCLVTHLNQDQKPTWLILNKPRIINTTYYLVWCNKKLRKLLKTIERKISLQKSKNCKMGPSPSGQEVVKKLKACWNRCYNGKIKCCFKSFFYIFECDLNSERPTWLNTQIILSSKAIWIGCNRLGYVPVILHLYCLFEGFLL